MISTDVIKIDESLCDGCGNCVTACAEGAIALVDGKARLVGEFACDGIGVCLGHCPQRAITIVPRENTLLGQGAVCPFAAQTATAGQAQAKSAGVQFGRVQWPVKLELISPSAAFVQDADLVLVADCAPMACRDFHTRFADGKAVALACPKLGNAQAQQVRLSELIGAAHPRSLKVIRMEVPCCGGLTHFAKKAAAQTGLPVDEIILNSAGMPAG